MTQGTGKQVRIFFQKSTWEGERKGGKKMSYGISRSSKSNTKIYILKVPLEGGEMYVDTEQRVFQEMTSKISSTETRWKTLD